MLGTGAGRRCGGLSELHWDGLGIKFFAEPSLKKFRFLKEILEKEKENLNSNENAQSRAKAAPSL